MPDDGLEQLKQHDAVYFGAAGWPATVPDHISLWGLLIPFRRGYDQYVNLRPVRLMPGMKCPLANRKPGDIDFWVVRENSEGEYSSVGGRMYAGTDREFPCSMGIHHMRVIEALPRLVRPAVVGIQSCSARFTRDAVTQSLGPGIGHLTSETRLILFGQLNLK